MFGIFYLAFSITPSFSVSKGIRKHASAHNNDLEKIIDGVCIVTQAQKKEMMELMKKSPIGTGPAGASGAYFRVFEANFIDRVLGIFSGDKISRDSVTEAMHSFNEVLNW